MLVLRIKWPIRDPWIILELDEFAPRAVSLELRYSLSLSLEPSGWDQLRAVRCIGWILLLLLHRSRLLLLLVSIKLEVRQGSYPHPDAWNGIYRSRKLVFGPHTFGNIKNRPSCFQFDQNPNN